MPALQSMEGHLQTSLEVWVDNRCTYNDIVGLYCISYKLAGDLTCNCVSCKVCYMKLCFITNFYDILRVWNTPVVYQHLNILL